MLLLRLMLIIPLVHGQSFLIPSLTDIWELAKLGFAIGGKIKEIYDPFQNFGEDRNVRTDRILSNIIETSNQVDGLEQRLDQRLDAIVESLVSRISLVRKLDTSFLQLHKTIVAIDSIWDNYLKYARDRRIYHYDTIAAFITSATGQHPGSLQDLLDQIHRLLIPLRTANVRESLLVTMLRNQRETELTSCNEGLSNQEAIFQIYYSVALTELRGYVMAAYAFGLRPLYQQGWYNDELNAVQARFILRTRDYLLATKEAMKLASNKIRRCDPQNGFKRGVSFAEMEELFQTYVVAELDINPRDSCRGTCEDIGRTTYLRGGREFDYARPCRGDVVNCRYGGGSMSICSSDYPRRYNWFREASGAVRGDYSVGCSRPLLEPRGWYRGLSRCDYCVCTCEANRATSKAKRAISFRSAQVNLNKNMVVTGIRLVQQAGMMHLQVREGLVQPRGIIEKGSEQWVPISNVRYEEADKFGRYWIDYPSGRVQLKRRIDYDFISNFDRTVNLDDVSAPEGHVVVGVRFNHGLDPRQANNPIRLEVMYKRWDYESGRLSNLLGDEAKWTAAVSQQPRIQVAFSQPDNPLKSTQNWPTLLPNLVVRFQESDTPKDAGQSTIPFWDIQEVVTTPSFPLSGVGLFHKGPKNGATGGYLALRLMTFDFTYNLNATLPDRVQYVYEQTYRQPLYSPVGVL